MYAIIAGTNKAGTTSVFRYLADHPAVCASRIKETDFFYKEVRSSAAARQAYDSMFPADVNDSRLRLEATPSYLRGGANVARRIRQIVPEVRLVFILREPVERLLSYIRTNRESGFEDYTSRLSVDANAELLIDVAQSGTEPLEPGPRRNAFIQFQRGCYATHLSSYLEQFPSRQIYIGFFDDLVKDTRDFIQRMARYLDLDPDFYTDYAFTVENRTRRHRSLRMYRALRRVNQQLEPLLNRHPPLRRTLRQIYTTLNEKKQKPKIGWDLAPELRERIASLYQPHNEALAELIHTTFPQVELPAWTTTSHTQETRITHPGRTL